MGLKGQGEEGRRIRLVFFWLLDEDMRRQLRANECRENGQARSALKP